MAKRSVTAVWLEDSHRWMSRVQKDGVRKSFYSGTEGRRGKAEAEAKARAWAEAGIACCNQRVNVLFQQYLDSIQKTSGTSTAHYRQYASLYKQHIEPEIGSKRLENVTEGHLQAIIDKGYWEHDLSAKTLKNIDRKSVV